MTVIKLFSESSLKRFTELFCLSTLLSSSSCVIVCNSEEIIRSIIVLFGNLFVSFVRQCMETTGNIHALSVSGAD